MGKAKRFNAYDDAVAEKRKLTQAYGQQRQDISGISSTFRSSPVSPPALSNTPGAGITFPITPEVEDHGNSGSGTIDIDLQVTTSHVHKITLTGNPTLTFSNPPVADVQIEFEIEFIQDATGGRSVTFPASLTDTVTIDPKASSTTIVTFRTNDKGTVYHALAVRHGASGGGPFLPLGGGTMTGDIIMGSNNITNISNLDFATGGGVIATVPSISVDGTGDMIFNVATGDDYQLAVGGVGKITLDTTALFPSTTAVTDLGKNTHFFSDVFTGTLDLGDATDIQTLLGTSTGITYNVKTGDSHVFSVNSVNTIEIASLLGTITGNFVPNVSVTRDLGSSSLLWSAVYTQFFRFDASTAFITWDAAGSEMRFEIPTGDKFNWEIANANILTADTTDFNVHDLNVINVAILALNGASGDEITSDSGGIILKIPTGDDFDYHINDVSQFTLSDNTIVFKSDSSAAVSFQTAKQPVGAGAAGTEAEWLAGGLDDADTVRTYGSISFFSSSAATAVAAGGLKLQAAYLSGLDTIITIDNPADVPSLSFFNQTVVARQTSTNSTPTADLTYSANERDMIQDMWDGLVAYGLLDES